MTILELIKTHQKKALVLTMLALPFVLMATNAGTGVGQTRTSAPGRVGQRAAGVGQAATFGMTATITDWISGRFGGQRAQEIELLEKENARLREEKARLIGVLQENMRLRELVGLKTRQDEYELVPAQVIARDTTPYFRVLKLRLQVDAKIEPRMPVVVAGGVVGQIHQVSGRSAEVILLADPRSRIDALSQRNRAHGIVQGLGHDRDYHAKISYLDQKDSVRPGDIMVTSGMAENFPRELVIGTVLSVEPDERGLFQYAVLEPAVDFGRLDTVFIITGKKAVPAQAEPQAP